MTTRPDDPVVLMGRAYLCDECGAMLLTEPDGDEDGELCVTTLASGVLVPCQGRMHRATEEDLFGKGGLNQSEPTEGK